MKIKNPVLNLLRDCCIVILAFAAMSIIAAIALNTSFMNPVAQTMKDFSLTDIYYYVLQDHGRTDTNHVVTIVDMTDLKSRAELTDVLEEIESMNPKTVGLDIVFEGLKPDTLTDIRLTTLVAEHTNTVFSYRFRDYIADTVGIGGEVHSFFSDIVPVREGYTNMERQLYGGVKRKMSLRTHVSGKEHTSFVYEVAQSYTGGKLDPLGNNVVNINFKPTSFRKISPDSIACHRDWIENQIVLYGALHEMSDMHYTPLGAMAGVELLAYSIQTLLEQSEEKHPNGWVTAMVSFILVLITYRGRKKYIEWAKSRKNEWVGFFLTTTFVVGFLLFVWTGLLAFCGFLLFMETNISFNLGWTMAAIPFLGGAGEFYGLTIRRCFGGFSAF